MESSLVKTQSEPVIDISKLNPEQQAKAREIAGQFDIEDSQSVVTFGVGAQRDIAGFSDTVLTQVRSKDSGIVGETLTDLVVNIKDLQVGRLPSGGRLGALARIPLLGSAFNAVRRFIAQYDRLSIQIERIIEELDKARMGLLKDITLLDAMYERNLQYLQNLDIYIAAGELKLKELLETVLPEMKRKAEASPDPVEAQKIQDFVQMINRFDKKIHDLKLSRMIAIQTAPQVRLIQNANQSLVEKIQSSILNTIPLWKNQIVIAITLFRQNKALRLQREISETTNELLQKNAALLKDNAAGAARESERGIVDIETLKKVNDDLIATIEETLKIQQEGRARRRQAEAELVKIERDLKDKLKTVGDIK